MTKPLLAVAALLSWQRASVVGAQILVAFVLAMATKFHHVGRQEDVFVMRSKRV
jgi:hypothetical protein